MEVYPRVYGGNPPPLPVATFPEGLSPRVRGKPLGGQAVTGIDRSIPACTGETNGKHRSLRSLEVYPRVYGGNN